MRVALNDISVSKEFYPRQKPDDTAVQRYRDNIEHLPPIVVAKINGEYHLVDGYHRILVHKLENRTEIDCTLREDLTTLKEVLAEAIRLNAAHGLQLSRSDKEQMARQLYGQFDVAGLAKLLAVSERIVREWTRGARETEKYEKEIKAVALFLSGETEPSIDPLVGEKENWTTRTLANYRQNGEFSKMSAILAATHPDEETAAKQAIIRRYLGGHLLDPTQPPPSLKVYDVWNFTKCDDHYGADYPGRIPGQILENLLWYYTEPFECVYDPFAGSGTTIDVCRTMFRRYWSSDVRPYDPTKGIRKWNIWKDGKPDFFPKGYKMDLVFMDPPYWSMKDDEYPEGSVSRLPLEEFYAGMTQIAKNCHPITADDKFLALIVQNQTGAGKGGFEGYLDHAFELTTRFSTAGWKPIRRIACPMPPDNNGGANEAKAKADRRMLGLVRDLIVFQKGKL